MYINMKAGDILNGARIVSFGLAFNPDFGTINLADGKIAWETGLHNWRKVGEPRERTRLKRLPVAAGDYVNGKKIEEIVKLSIDEDMDCAILDNGEHIFNHEITTWQKGE